MGDQFPALQHRLVVGEEPVELHERRDRHDEERVQRAGRHEAGKGSLLEQGQRTTSSFGCPFLGRIGDGSWRLRCRVEHDGVLDREAAEGCSFGPVVGREALERVIELSSLDGTGRVRISNAFGGGGGWQDNCGGQRALCVEFLESSGLGRD